MGESISPMKTATSISLYGPIRPASRPLEFPSLTSTVLSPIITNPYFSVSYLATVEITLTPDSQLPAVIVLNDLHYGLISIPNPLPITSLSLRYVPISDVVLIKILHRIPLLRKISIIEPDRVQRSKHLPVITEWFVNYLRKHPTLKIMELVFLATARSTCSKENGAMDMLEHRVTIGLLEDITIEISYGREMSAQTLERLKQLREQGIIATQ
ncbi:hypothetical protein IW262DRAFT_1401113 [Armillaria fumosa]|nr:hypothetical protein IW262DRAFT_1401113 [Armillaria fumosa]